MKEGRSERERGRKREEQREKEKEGGERREAESKLIFLSFL